MAPVATLMRYSLPLHGAKQPWGAFIMAQMIRSMFIFVWERDRDASTFLSRLASINRDVHPRTVNSVILRWLQSWLKPQFSLHSTGMINPIPILWAIPVRKALNGISRNWRPYSFAYFAANLCSILSINPCYYYNPDPRAEALMCRTSKNFTTKTQSIHNPVSLETRWFN